MTVELKDMPHPSYGDPNITVGMITNAREKLCNMLCSLMLTKDFIEKVSAQPHRRHEEVIYKIKKFSGDRICGMSIYSLLLYEEDWTMVENTIMSELSERAIYRPKVCIVRDSEKISVKITWTPWKKTRIVCSRRTGAGPA